MKKSSVGLFTIIRLAMMLMGSAFLGPVGIVIGVVVVVAIVANECSSS